MTALLQNLALLYLGGSLAIALACLAMFRQQAVGEATRRHGRVRSLREAVLLSALWLPAMIAFLVSPRLLNSKRR